MPPNENGRVPADDVTPEPQHLSGMGWLWCHSCHYWHRISDDCPKGARNAYTTDPARTLATPAPRLSSDPVARKNAPMARGLLDYFPKALAAVAECSRVANEQHNPGEPMHWSREKSDDHADSCIRHMVDRGLIDKEGIRHSTKAAWRALANLEIELEEDNPLPDRAAGNPISRVLP